MDGKSSSPAEQRKGLSDWLQARARMGQAPGAVAEIVNQQRPPDKPQPRLRRPGSTDGVRRITPPPGPVPLSKQLKDVLQYLQEAEGEPRSWQEITHAPALHRYDLSAGGELYQALRANPRVEWVGDMLAYKSEHGITNKQQLVDWLRRHPSGTRLPQITDAYKTVEQDVDEALAEGLLFKIFNYDLQCFVLFPVDVAMMQRARLDVDVLALYRDTQVPDNPVELQAALTKMNLPSRLANVTRKRVALPPQKKDGQRKKRGFNIRNATNVHLADMLQSEGPTSIDQLPDGH